MFIVVLTLVHTNQYELLCNQWETKVFLFYFTFTSKRSPTIQATSDTKWQIDYPTLPLQSGIGCPLSPVQERDLLDVS